MELAIGCECGDSLKVSEGLAGTSIDCHCGRKVMIPSLPDLREQAGLSRFPVSPDIKVTHLVESGELPPEKCMQCNGQSDCVAKVIAVCESEVRSGGEMSMWGTVIFSVLALVTLRPFLLLFLDDSPAVIHGRNTFAPTPVALCNSCRSVLFGRQKYFFVFSFFAAVLLIAGIVLAFSNIQLGFAVIGAAFLTNVTGAILKTNTSKNLRRVIVSIDEYRELIDHYPQTFFTSEGRKI